MQIFKTMGKSEFCVLTKHCFLMGKNTVQAKQWLDKCYLDSAPVKQWLRGCRLTLNTVIQTQIIDAFEERNHQKTATNEEKVFFHQDNTLCYKLITTMAKLHELHFKFLPHPPYSPDLAPSDSWLFADLKRMLQGKRFGSNEEVTSETEAYFAA